MPNYRAKTLSHQYFEGIDSERGIAYGASDSLSLREFLGLRLEQTPDHSTLSKTRRLMNLGTHKAMCTVTELAGQAEQADAVRPVETVSQVGVEWKG